MSTAKETDTAIRKRVYMDIKRAKQEIKDAVEAYLLKDSYGDYMIPSVFQRPLLLIGAPGIGKTQIMEQVARECGIALVAYTITHHTRQSAIGLPFITEREYDGENKAVTRYTMSEIIASIYEKREKTGIKEGILFIDEINCVSETLAPAMLQFLQYKTFGNQSIPEGWIIAAAGNPPEYNKSVREFDVVTMDRVRRIDVEPDYSCWREYALENGLHPAILSYLDIRPEHFYKMENTVDGRRFATPRGWEDLSRVIRIYDRLGKKADREVVKQYIQHDEVSAQFAAYLDLYKKYNDDYGIQEILGGTVRKGTYGRLSHAPFDERLSVVNLLLYAVIDRMKEVREKELFTEALYERMLKAKESLERDDVPASEAAAVLEKLKKDTESERTLKRKAELLTRDEERRLLKLSETLSSYVSSLGERNPGSGREAFEMLKELFAAETAGYDALCTDTGSAVEHAFDFLGDAFGEGQETVIFITGLNMSGAAVSFLSSYDCERYADYNRRLLFKESDMSLRREAMRLEGL